MKMHEKKTHEPPFHVVKRDGMPVGKAMLIRTVTVVIALLFCSLLAKLMINANPAQFIASLFDGAFGSPRRLWVFAKETSILLCIALAITPAFRMRFWNIGAEGQTLVGALASVAMVIYFGGKVPNPLLLVIMFVAAVLAGAVWGGLPAVFKAKWGTNETLFTLMMNYVASSLVLFFIQIWVPDGSQALKELKFGHLPVIINQYFIVILTVLVLTVLMFIYLHYTKQGYEISVVGESERTAKYIGIHVGKVIIRTMLISGAVCGIAGFLIVGGLDHSVTPTAVGGMGFTAIMVSWLAKFNPFVMIGTSAFITFLETGASQIVTKFNIDTAFPDIVVGIVLFLIIGCEFFISYRLKFRESHKKGAETA